MANQLQVTVVRSNGSTYTQSFSVNDIWVQENTGSATVNAIIWVSNEISYKVSETISALATLAGSSMIQATVKQLPSGERENFQALFPSAACAIGQSTGTSGINSFVIFKTQSYYCSETQSALVTAANAGGGGGSGLALESYQNSAMSSAVMAYVFRDEDDNIYRVYEPIKNNDVRRKQYAYADSIGLFPFDSAVGNTINDVKLVDLASDVVISKNSLANMVIKGNNHTGLEVTNNQWAGLNGIGCPNLAEIHVSGNDVQIDGNIVGSGSETDGDGAAYFDSIGTGSQILLNNIIQSAGHKFNGFSSYYAYNTAGVFSLVEWNADRDLWGNILGHDTHFAILAAGAALIDNCINGGDLTINIAVGLFARNTINNQTFSSYDVIQDVDGCTFGNACSISTTNGSLTGCTLGDNVTYFPASNQTGKIVFNIGGTAYILEVTDGAVTATAV